ncbi:MAG: hypothetical protein H6559_33085 [Lewinellaceae bacterium]|nr:hypothetical protein [Lewinellaceae bacterium]
MTEFFRQSENFGRKSSKPKTSRANSTPSSPSTPTGTRRAISTWTSFAYWRACIKEDGELRDFGMLESFSTFVKIKDLEQIRFVDMQNFLEIRKQRLYLPAMFIRSNALNMTISGEHTFNNEIEYNIKVNAGQVLVPTASGATTPA